MARFQFTLDKILRWRTAELSAEESKLKRLIVQEQQLRSRRAAMGAERVEVAETPGTMPDVSGTDLAALPYTGCVSAAKPSNWRSIWCAANANSPHSARITTKPNAAPAFWKN